MLIIRWWKLIPLHQYCRLAMVSVQRQPRRWHGSWSRTGVKNAGMCDQRSLSAQREFPCRTTLFFGLDQKKTTIIHKTMKINIGKVQMSMALIPPTPTTRGQQTTILAILLSSAVPLKLSPPVSVHIACPPLINSSYFMAFRGLCWLVMAGDEHELWRINSRN